MGKPSPNVHIRYPNSYILANMVVKYQKVGIHISEYENLRKPIFDYGEFGNGIFDYGEFDNGIFDYVGCIIIGVLYGVLYGVYRKSYYIISRIVLLGVS